MSVNLKKGSSIIQMYQDIIVIFVKSIIVIDVYKNNFKYQNLI